MAEALHVRVPALIDRHWVPTQPNVAEIAYVTAFNSLQVQARG